MKYLVIVFLIQLSFKLFNTEIYSSIDSMQDLAEDFHNIVYDLEIFSKTVHSAYVDRKLKEFHDENDLIQKNVREYITNPINAWKIIKMVTEDLEILNELHDGKLNETIHNIYVHHPLQHEDMAGAVQGLFRLHEVYRFSCEDFSNGIIDGKTTREPLTAHDLYSIATVAVELRKYFFATKYFRLTLKAIGYGFNPQELNPAKVRFELAQNYEKSGKYYKAIKQAKRAKSLSKDFKLKAMKLINDANHLVQIGFKGPKIRNPFSDKYKRNGKFSERKEMILFSQVCRGNITKSFKEQSKLKCRYVSNSFYTKLVKSKVEEFNLKPYIVAFHDVVSDQEVELLKIIGKPHKKRSKLEVPDDDEGLISKHRVSQVAWFEDLHDDEIAFVTKLYKRISAITGLSLDDSEALQLQNYGIAGHYAPHWDHSTKFDSAPQYFGNRVATFLIYMTDIEKGGYTAFPYVKTRIPPIKNGAAFWYNLNPLGVGDSYTKHAACPVILGEKWVGNKWISEPDQMFIRKCPIGVKFKEEDTDSYYKDFF